MFRRPFQVAQISGIPIRISSGWVLSVVFYSWALGTFCLPVLVQGISPVAAYPLGLLSTLLLFVGVLAHELGHASIARRHGTKVEGINLGLLGGGARLWGNANTPKEEILYSLAGPAVTAAIIIGLFGLLFVLPSGTPKVVSVLVFYQLFMNAMILAFNLLPIFPLDGGRALRSLLQLRREHTVRPSTSNSRAFW